LDALPPTGHRMSTEWHHSSSPKAKKFQMQPSIRKIMLILFWNEGGILLEPYTRWENTIMSASYYNLVKNHLQPAVRSKWHGLWPNTAHATVATVQDCSLSVFHICHTHQT
jgi:hypothetical protein